MKGKRGFLLAEETLKIILALISISFLIYFLTALYFSSQDSKELEQAEASLEFLIKEINAGREEVEIYNPEGWWIASWPFYQETNLFTSIFLEEGEIIPKSCSNLGWKNCICIYPKGFSLSKAGNAENSDEKGICKEISKRTIVSSTEKQSPIKIINPPLTLNIEYGDEIIIKK